MKSTCGINKYKSGTTCEKPKGGVSTDFEKRLAEMQKQRAAIDSMWQKPTGAGEAGAGGAGGAGAK